MAVVQKSGRCEVVVDASPESVWQVVSDPTRTGEWSHECRQVRWLGESTAAVPGARFRGRNRAGWARWGRTCEVVVAEAGQELAWRTVPSPLYPDSSIWRIRIEPSGTATRIVQEFEVERAPVLLDHIFAAVIPSHRDRTASLTADLERLGAVARGEDPVDDSVPPSPHAARNSSRRLSRAGNRIAVRLYRRFDGRLSSGRRGVDVMLLTVPGRRTGLARATCVRFLSSDEGWLVWGTGSGSRRDPDWFENLRAAQSATVQIGSAVAHARARELVGAERDAVWTEVVLARAPEVARYAAKAGRTIPVALLTPV
jgi:deazaflavin-dependent oxidoreductase (nitroreductase family)